MSELKKEEEYKAPPTKKQLEEMAQKAKNRAANKNNNIGQMDHSKRND